MRSVWVIWRFPEPLTNMSFYRTSRWNGLVVGTPWTAVSSSTGRSLLVAPILVGALTKNFQNNESKFDRIFHSKTLFDPTGRRFARLHWTEVVQRILCREEDCEIEARMQWIPRLTPSLIPAPARKESHLQRAWRAQRRGLAAENDHSL